MAKRKLTHQQRARIKKQHDSRRQLAVTDSSDAEVSGQSGTVIANHGKTVIIEDQDHNSFTCHPRQNIETLVCGDQVIWQQEDDSTGVILALLPRRTFLARPDKHGKARIVAANIDQLFVVSAAKPILNTRLIDRYLVAAEIAGITPIIIFNKIDLPDHEGMSSIKAQLAIYDTLDYQVIFTCAKQPHGIDELNPILQDKVSVFVGQSGVGKSSLINVLLPTAQASVGKVSDSTNKGRHTTTLAQLYHMPNGGELIDSPGIREFGLWQVDIKQAASGFIEFRPFIGQCRFRDCLHEDEPGCEIRAAVEKGMIDKTRWESYRRILDSLR